MNDQVLKWFESRSKDEQKRIKKKMFAVMNIFRFLQETLACLIIFVTPAIFSVSKPIGLLILILSIIGFFRVKAYEYISIEYRMKTNTH